jgi:hypothetical protein
LTSCLDTVSFLPPSLSPTGLLTLFAMSIFSVLTIFTIRFFSITTLGSSFIIPASIDSLLFFIISAEVSLSVDLSLFLSDLTLEPFLSTPDVPVSLLSPVGVVAVLVVLVVAVLVVAIVVVVAGIVVTGCN